jgi:ubiquinone biosynthesis protein UbiJ
MFLESAERLLNRFVSESTPARHKLRDLAGKTLALEVAGLSLTVRIAAHPDRIAVAPVGNEAAADVTIRATPLDLLKLAGRDRLADLRETHAQIRGDLHVAEDFAELLRFAKPDAEEELARWVGDVPAHGLGETARRLLAWAERTHLAMETNIAEYLQEESEQLPHRSEYVRFVQDVETLRDAIERDEQRLTRIAEALAE